MVSCSVFRCASDSKQGKGLFSFYRLPRDLLIKRKWLIKLKLPNISSKAKLQICQKHFEADCFERDLKV